MIDAKATADGGIRFEIDGKHHEMPAHMASAFLSVVLDAMTKQAAKIGDNTPEGGAILYPDSAAVELDRESGEPRLRLGFGKALFVVSMPKGQMRGLAEVIASM